MVRIAVIGGGFSGLSVTSNLIHMLRKAKKKASITIFEQNGKKQSSVYHHKLPHDFTLNHEANNMGVVNFYLENAGNDDFYQWIQDKKNESLSCLSGKTVAAAYNNCDLGNPQAYLPRSLYGHYLKYRFEQLLSLDDSIGSIFCSPLKVNKIKKNKGKYIVISGGEEYEYDIVVVATGYWHRPKSEKALLTAEDIRNNSDLLDIPLTKSIGILGTSLSAIECALSLKKKGYKKIIMYSRHGRFPKVRGKIVPYTLKYINSSLLLSLQSPSGYISLTSLAKILKKEFSFAYKNTKGLYKAKGINWKEIILNKNPIKQLEDDISASEKGEELVWRSVLTSLFSYENEIWEALSLVDQKLFFSTYSSLLSSFVAPMPLFQAKDLLNSLKNKSISYKSKIENYKYEKDKWVLKTGHKNEFVDYLIDARGYLKDISHNPLIVSLINEGLVEKHPLYGVNVNEDFQSTVKNSLVNNLYIVGPTVYGKRPFHNGTTFSGKYAKILAKSIMTTLMSEKIIESNNSIDEINSNKMNMLFFSGDC